MDSEDARVDLPLRSYSDRRPTPARRLDVLSDRGDSLFKVVPSSERLRSNAWSRGRPDSEEAGVILAATGHRPEELGGYSPNGLTAWVERETRAALLALRPEKCISGMALGFDQIFAEACIEMGIPFIAAVPCATQASVWPEAARVKWRRLIERSERVEILSPIYTRSCMQIRNKWMVDHADALLACWNGDQEGGTWNCIEYARRRRVPIATHIDPSKWKVYGSGGP